jgi:diadenosine tetraphosphatase ApaH/serine/threonine PP2A family protein phosphatase
VGNHDQYLTRLINEPTIVSDVANREQWKKEFGSGGDAETIIRHFKTLYNVKRADEIKQQIEKLPAMISPLPGVYLAHGSFGLNKRPLAERPRECVEEYIKQYYDVATTWEVLGKFVKHPSALPGIQRMRQARWEKPRVMIVGHWHQRNLYKFERDKWQPSIVVNDRWINEWIDLPNDPAEPILINPGSVGSPRLPKDHTMPRDLCASYAMLDWGGHHSRVMFRRVQYNRRETVRLLQEGLYPEQVYARLEGNCTHAHSHQCPWCIKES